MNLDKNQINDGFIKEENVTITIMHKWLGENNILIYLTHK